MIDQFKVHLSTYSSDIFFWLQIIFAGFFCVSELLHILHETAEGVSITMFVAVEVFLGINLYLSYHTYKKQLNTGNPAKATRYSFWTYLFWFTLWGACLLAVAYKLAYNFSDIWSFSEWVTTGSVIIGLLFVFVYAKTNKKTKEYDTAFKDPMVKGYTALVFKSFPQFGQAWKFYTFGGMSWGLEGLLFGHVTIMIRIVQLWLSYREVGKWTRNLKGSLRSELCNEFSWLTATGVWIWWQYF